VKQVPYILRREKEKQLNEFQRKSHFDLWMHQNQLFWSRFQLLNFIQIAYFLIISAIRSEKHYVWTAFGPTLLLLVWLFSTTDQDRRLRNWHASMLKTKYAFDPLPAKVTTVKWIPPEWIELAFELSIFLPFAVGDYLAAHYLTSIVTMLFIINLNP
jgi:hypothetical protein